MINNRLKSPLFAKGEERVVERSKDRVSKIWKRAVDVNILAAITHPDIATLVDPLFAARKEGKEILFNYQNAC